MRHEISSKLQRNLEKALDSLDHPSGHEFLKDLTITLGLELLTNPTTLPVAFDMLFRVKEVLICPITMCSIETAGILESGSVFEYSAISHWLIDHDTDPLTNLRLKHKLITQVRNYQEVHDNKALIQTHKFFAQPFDHYYDWMSPASRIRRELLDKFNQEEKNPQDCIELFPSAPISVNVMGVQMRNADFFNQNTKNARVWYRCEFTNVTFVNCVICMTKFVECKFVGVTFQECKFVGPGIAFIETSAHNISLISPRIMSYDEPKSASIQEYFENKGLTNFVIS
jgi:hypothetical protein